jgi:tRNA U38,U39,U40 pseudouridine synthase TruA
MLEILDARDREAAGRPAPAGGLTLERVSYARQRSSEL